jgi:hypothetical protein
MIVRVDADDEQRERGAAAAAAQQPDFSSQNVTTMNLF